MDQRNNSNASLDAVIDVVSEIVELTSKNVSEESVNHDQSDKGQIVSNSNHEPSVGATENVNKEDLPVRRSSRIQRLTVKKDEVNKKRTTKPTKTNKTATSSETNSSTNVQEIIPTPSIQTGLKVQSVLDFSESDKYKSTKTTKKADQKLIQKLEKEDTKAVKLKPEKKRTYRKKKQNTDSENSPDHSASDIRSSSDLSSSTDMNKDKFDVTNDNSAPTSSEPVVNLPSDENKVPDVLSCNSKPSDNPVLDVKDEPSPCSNLKPVKVKSRWWRSSELEGVLNTEPITHPGTATSSQSSQDEIIPSSVKMETNEEIVEMESNNLPQNIETPSSECSLEQLPIEQPVYEHIEENIYKFTRKKSKNKKQVRRMVCDCTLSKEELEYGVLGCKEECLNRLLMIECGSRCPIGDACSNKKFQKKQYISAEIIKTEKKGWGLKALENISSGDFLMEFVGEVLNHKEYRQRVKLYAKEKNVHCYFMALKTDEILDATSKGNLTRFINHSCDPNCETQKWTVNGELRVGVFAKRVIYAGEEFTLDYKFQRYGREAQKCFCMADNCSGYIGGAKQISIDAYSGTKVASTKKKKGLDDKKREWEDMILEEEIEKLNTGKGLRNREETLKLARLMVRADDSATRHQILDIIIRTEEQACLRLFLDYHGLPLMWSWMTDIVDLDLKAKILQVLVLLPVTNKTMLLDSKVMSVVEKWVQEYDLNISGRDESTESQDLSALPGSTDENSEPVAKKLKNIDFSDNETDSTDSHNAVDNSSENSSSLNENNEKSEISPIEPMQCDPVTEDKSASKNEDDPLIELKTNISSTGAELLKSWKNLKEVFRIPRLEQQKRKEDELEADHKIREIKIEEPSSKIEVTGDHIQVLISSKTPSFSDNIRTYQFDIPEDYKLDDRPRKNLLPIPQNTRLNRHKRLPLLPNPNADEIVQRSIKEESDSSLDSASPLLSAVTSPVVQPSNRPALLPTPTLISQPPVNFPPPINTSIPPHPQLDQTPQAMYPPQMVFPPTQAPYMVTAGPPPVIPTSMPPPSTVFPQPAPLLTQPPPAASIPSCPPMNSGLPPNPAGFQLPPTLPAPGTSQFIPNQVPGVPNYPPGPTPYRNSSQPFYFLQQPPTVPNSSAPATFAENVCVQSSAILPVPSANTMPLQSSPFPLQSSASLPTQSPNPVPMQSVNPLPIQTATSVSIQPTTYMPVIDQLSVQAASPVPKEEPKPVKLPKNWRSATDSEGNIYYYHSVTRETQWDPPTADQIENDSGEDDESDSEESDSSDTPTYDEPKIITKHSRRKSKKRKATRPAADTTVSFPVRPETAKKIKELFRTKMSSYIVHCLNSYRKPDCKVGRITSNEDFKYLARKLTHYTMTKELKQCKNVEDLDCNDCVMHKARDFIKKYMSKYGSKYSRKEKFSPEA